MSELTWEFDEETLLLTAVFRGALRFETVIAFWDVVGKHAREPMDVLALIDARAADLSHLTVEDFKLMEDLRRDGDIPTGRAAAVVDHDGDIGIARLWAAFRNESVPGSTAVFTDIDAAKAWLFDGR